MTYTLTAPTNLKHWVEVMPMLAGPNRNKENIMQVIDSQGEDWELVSTELHEGYLYLFFVIKHKIQVVEIYKPPMEDSEP